jgi:hypothetical protein
MFLMHWKEAESLTSLAFDRSKVDARSVTLCHSGRLEVVGVADQVGSPWITRGLVGSAHDHMINDLTHMYVEDT